MLALAVMIYHITEWTIYQSDSGGILGRLGIYAVSMFFILSGLSMALVYTKFIRDLQSSVSFFIRRIFRIWPLLWLVVFIVTAGQLFLNKSVDWFRVLINLTTIFSFISPGSYINTGAWSIGNEVVYYALTPIIIRLFKIRLLYGNIIFVITLLVGLYFACFSISNKTTLANQWQIYINPFNNLFFYCAGIAIYFNLDGIYIRRKNAILIMLGASLVFSFYPAAGDQVNIVTGVNRVIFSLASIVMVIAFYKIEISNCEFFDRLFTWFGMIAYGLYLLHPLMFQFTQIFFRRIGLIDFPVLVIFTTIGLTIFVSGLAFRWLEVPLIGVGKRITSTLLLN